MTDPRIIPDEKLARYKADAERECTCGADNCTPENGIILALLDQIDALAERVDHQRAKFCWHDPEGQYAAMQARADAAEQRLADRDKAIRDLLGVPYGGADWGVLHEGVRHIPAPAVHALLTEDSGDV